MPEWPDRRRGRRAPAGPPGRPWALYIVVYTLCVIRAIASLGPDYT